MSRNKFILTLIKALAIAYIITGLLVFVTAWISYKMDFADKEINLFVTFIYIISNSVAGLYMGKCMKEKGFAWGALCGAIYGAFLMLVSVVISGGAVALSLDGLCALLLSIAGGTFGGMIS